MKLCILQYVGSTTYLNLDSGGIITREIIRKQEEREEYMQPLVFEHFPSNDHHGFLEDCSITLIDKTIGFGCTGRQIYWRRVLKTVTPYESNTIKCLFGLGKSLFPQIFSLEISFYGQSFNVIASFVLKISNKMCY